MARMERDCHFLIAKLQRTSSYCALIDTRFRLIAAIAKTFSVYARYFLTPRSLVLAVITPQHRQFQSRSSSFDALNS